MVVFLPTMLASVGGFDVTFAEIRSHTKPLGIRGRLCSIVMSAVYSTLTDGTLGFG